MTNVLWPPLPFCASGVGTVGVPEVTGVVGGTTVIIGVVGVIGVSGGGTTTVGGCIGVVSAARNALQLVVLYEDEDVSLQAERAVVQVLDAKRVIFDAS